MHTDLNIGVHMSRPVRWLSQKGDVMLSTEMSDNTSGALKRDESKHKLDQTSNYATLKHYFSPCLLLISSGSDTETSFSI